MRIIIAAFVVFPHLALARDTFKELTSTAAVLQKFDGDHDQNLSEKEFGALCENLFRNSTHRYQSPAGTLEELFRIFDRNSDGRMSRSELDSCYNDWVSKVVKPISVLVVVDVQNDFITGSLSMSSAPAGQDGKEEITDKCSIQSMNVVAPINKLLDEVPFHYVYYTKDWHPANHISFVSNVPLRKLHATSLIKNPKDAKILDTVIFEGDQGKPVEQRLWPVHSIQNTWGSELDPDLKVAENSKVVYKAWQADVDSYSAFLDNSGNPTTPLKDYIDEVGAKDVYVTGLAYDVCAGFTAIDGLKLGYRVVMVDDAIRGVDLAAIEKTKHKFVDMNGVITFVDKVKDMVLGVDRRPEMGLQLAQNLYQNNAPVAKRTKL